MTTTTTIRLDQLTAEQREALFHDNIKLAEYIAKRYGQGRLPHDDRRQAARIGLMKAARKWDPTLSEQFSPYAAVAVRREIDRVSCREVISAMMTDIDGLAACADGPDPEQELLNAQQEQELERIAAEQHRELVDAAAPRKRAWRGHVWSPREVVEMYAKGTPQARIALALGVSRQRIGQIVADARKRAAQ